jgi:hypothetical protein
MARRGDQAPLAKVNQRYKPVFPVARISRHFYLCSL